MTDCDLTTNDGIEFHCQRPGCGRVFRARRVMPPGAIRIRCKASHDTTSLVPTMHPAIAMQPPIRTALEAPPMVHCVHRGDVVRLAQCPTCNDPGRQLKVFRCALHGECVARQFRLNDTAYKSCASCKDATGEPAQQPAAVEHGLIKPDPEGNPIPGETVETKRDLSPRGIAALLPESGHVLVDGSLGLPFAIDLAALRPGVAFVVFSRDAATPSLQPPNVRWYTGDLETLCRTSSPVYVAMLLMSTRQGTEAVLASVSPGGVVRFIEPASAVPGWRIVHGNGITRDKSEPLPVRGKVRVGFFTPHLLCGGAERWVSTLVRGLPDHSIEIAGVAVLNENADHFGPIIESVRAACPVTFGAKASHKLAKRCDVIIAWGQFDVSALFNFRGRSIFCATGHCIWSEQFCRKCGPYVTHHVACSHDAARSYPPEYRVDVLYNGMDVERCQAGRSREEVRAAWGVKPEEVLVAHVGRLGTEKNPLAAVRAVQALGPGFRAALIGSGPRAEQYRADARRALPDVICVDPVEAVGEVYRAVDCVIMASEYEGFCLVVAEAAYCGTPLVCTRVGVVETEAEHGEMFVKIPQAATPEELADAVREAISPQNAERVARAKAVAAKEFTGAAMCERWRRYILGLVHREPKIVAVVPTRVHPTELDALLRVLKRDGIETILLDSADFDHRLYRMWNHGIQEARARGATHVAVLNDDIEILPGTLRTMADALDGNPPVTVVYPDFDAPWEMPRQTSLVPTVGIWTEGGMCGFCFMFRAGDSVPIFDESYFLFCADKVWEAEVRARGGVVARVAGLPIRHDAGTTTQAVLGTLGERIAADHARFALRERGKADPTRWLRY